MLLLGRLVRMSRVRMPFLVVATGAAVVLAVLLLASIFGPVARPAGAVTNASFTPLDEIPPTAQQVTVGVFPISVYNMDFSGNTYFVEAYVWFRWQGDINPIESMEFVNAVDQWGLSKSPFYDEPVTLSDGSLYQGMRISGRFFQPFSLDRFPLDEQKLTLLIEDSAHSSQDLIYIADTADSGYSDILKIPGWNIKSWNVEALLHSYASAFGDTDSTGSMDRYAAVRYQLLIDRSVGYFLWKLLLPLVIVIAITLSALLIPPGQVDIRMALPTSALLTAVFLQQSYTSSLPDSGNLVLMDRLYVMAYLVIVLTMIDAVWAAHRVEKLSDTAVIHRVDRILFLMALLLIVVTSTTIVFTY